jgi:UDP-N-acetyl-D-mannosaminuronic acid dehydrogenase
VAFERDLVVVGGCGHVGLPLGILFADSGLRVSLYDINRDTVQRVNAGEMPFDEPGADEVLAQGRREGRLEATTDPDVISTAENLVVVVGTPVDRHLNPEPEGVPRAIAEFQDQLRDGQLLVLRSTVYPGVTALVERQIRDLQRDVDVSFCPERIAEGRAMVELCALPQIVSGRTPRSVERAATLFRRLADEIVELQPEEAELAKLFTNTWRYIKFATANQLYMIANDYGLDFERIRAAVTQHYPRAADMPSPGFSAGPCLFKDTMQLAAFNNNNFTLGHASMMINEGLPLYTVARMERRWNLSNQIVGILGTAFKAESDDIRSSLAYKLKRILRFKSAGVLTTDPYVTADPDLRPLDEVVERSDILVIGTPHRVYATLQTDKPVVDIFGIRRQGVLV